MNRGGDVGRDVSRALDMNGDMSGRLNPLLLLMDHLWSRGLWVGLWSLCGHPLLLVLELRQRGRLVLNRCLWWCVPLGLGLGVPLQRNLRSNGAPRLWRRNCTDLGHLSTLRRVRLGHHGCPLLLLGRPRWH